jgi:hypothetical protein
MTSLTTASSNVVVGEQALVSDVSGTDNEALGAYSLNTTTGSNNVGVGSSSGQSVTSGAGNVFIGKSASQSAGITSGQYNTFVGFAAQNSGSNVSNSSCLGYNCVATASNEIVLGTSAEVVQIIKNTFSTLPACASGYEGTLKSVSDSTTNTWGATITGSGSDHVLAYCDGTNWTVAAK